jgi:hypothetical protein
MVLILMNIVSHLSRLKCAKDKAKVVAGLPKPKFALQRPSTILSPNAMPPKSTTTPSKTRAGAKAATEGTRKSSRTKGEAPEYERDEDPEAVVHSVRVSPFSLAHPDAS